MTISSTATRKAGPYAGNGSTDAFAFSFKVFADSDLVVTHTDDDGLETVKTLTTHYTVALNANQNSNPGGTVTMLTAPATGEKLTITSAVPKTQAVNLSDGGGFFASVVNNALDRLTIFAQELAERLGRAMSLPVSVDAGVSAELPTPTAGKLLAWASDGLSIVNSPPTGVVAGSITATELASDAVETAKIKDANVTAAKLATDAVETAKIKDANVTAAKLAADSVTAAKLATDAVETAKIKDANVTEAKLATDAVSRVAKVGFTRSLASGAGSQAVTGVGFTPKAVVLLATVAGTPSMSIGFSAGVSASAVLYDDSYSSAGAYATAGSGNHAISLYTAAGVYGKATVASLDADGFTLTWSTSGSPTGTANCYALCFR